MTFISKLEKEHNIPKIDSKDIYNWDFRIPKANIWETEKEIQLELELPGTSKENIDISYKNGNLVIESKKKKEEFEDYEYSEFKNVPFYRSFKIEDTIEEEKIQANLENGLLSIFLPLKISPKKQIKIN